VLHLQAMQLCHTCRLCSCATLAGCAVVPHLQAVQLCHTCRLCSCATLAGCAVVPHLLCPVRESVSPRLTVVRSAAATWTVPGRHVHQRYRTAHLHARTCSPSPPIVCLCVPAYARTSTSSSLTYTHMPLSQTRQPRVAPGLQTAAAWLLALWACPGGTPPSRWMPPPKVSRARPVTVLRVCARARMCAVSHGPCALIVLLVHMGPLKAALSGCCNASNRAHALTHPTRAAAVVLWGAGPISPPCAFVHTYPEGEMASMLSCVSPCA